MIKWIGQHIWDFVSRFRNDVYLENIADGTVDSDKFLGLDSNNKIVKEAVSSGVSLGNDGNDRVVTATGGGALNGEANLTWNNIQLGLEYSGSAGPTILLTKTYDDATAPIINFVAQRAASGGAANNDDDYLGYTRYWGYNNASTPEAIEFARISGQISERDDGVEEGSLALLVQARGALRTGFSCVANGGNIIDTTIGTGATSVATIAGDAYITSDIELGHASDTTIARSAAGKVTIEGNEIQTRNKHIVILRSVHWSSSTSGYFLTIGGGSTGESTSLSQASYTTVFNCPYDGKVLRAQASTQTTSSKTVKLEMYINKDDSDLVADQRGSDWNVSSYTSSWVDDSPGDWTFSKGENIAIKATDSAATYGAQYTFVLEFDLTT
jgi:hypothetical protein